MCLVFFLFSERGAGACFEVVAFPCARLTFRELMYGKC